MLSTIIQSLHSIAITIEEITLTITPKNINFEGILLTMNVHKLTKLKYFHNLILDVIC